MRLIWTLETFSWGDVQDVLVVAAIIFVVTLFVRGTRAAVIMRGTLAVVLAIALLATVLEWIAFQWLLDNLITMIIVAIPVVFQPELRRALESLGRTGFRTFFTLNGQHYDPG
ncbi:MAG: hypothetical protein GYB65_19510 [Chloroflexi bacterium]|nr:hypothetical protein [Chloroflexota bacterium]